jgi:hypothetical protein
VLTPRHRRTGSNLVDAGRDAARDRDERSTPKLVEFAGEEATSNVCGVGVAMLSGHQLGTSLVDRSLGERGNHSRSPYRLASQASRGQARRWLLAVEWGGGLVVLRAGESPVHGEGDQQVSSEVAGRPGGRR